MLLNFYFEKGMKILRRRAYLDALRFRFLLQISRIHTAAYGWNVSGNVSYILVNKKRNSR